MYELIPILQGIDKCMAQLASEESKKKYLIQMMKLECRYNIDIIHALNFNKVKETSDEILKVLELLSVNALEKCLEYSYRTETESFIFNISGELTEKLIRKLSQSSFNRKEIDDPIFFNLYKRILVLKAIARLGMESEGLKKINYRLRIQNLKQILLIVANAQF